MKRIALVAVALALWPGPARGDMEPVDLVVTDTHVAAVTHDFSALWVVDRAARATAAAIPLRETTFRELRERRFGGVSAAELLVAADAGTAIHRALPRYDGWLLLSLWDELPPYAVPAPWIDHPFREQLPDVGQIGLRRFVDVGKPAAAPFRSLSAPLVAYDLVAARVVIGRDDLFGEPTVIDFGGRAIKTPTPYPDAISDPTRGRLVIPVPRTGTPISTGEGAYLIFVELPGGGVTKVPVGADALGARGVVSPDGRWLYLVGRETQVIDLETLAVAKRRRNRYLAQAAGFGPDGAEFYLLEGLGDSLEVLDAQGLDVLWTLDLPAAE